MKLSVKSAIIGALLGGGALYGVSLLSFNSPEMPSAETATEPWYKQATQPPQMVRLPDAPLILAPDTAELDPEIVEISPSPRIGSVDLSAKPSAPVYEEQVEQVVVLNTPIEEATKAKPQVPSSPPVSVVPQVPELVSPQEFAQARWQRHAVALAAMPPKPWVAIVIDDLGLDQKRSHQIVDLSAPLTLAYIPYARHLDRQTAQAREQGHELLVHLPMEPLNAKLDAGPNHLNTALPEDVIRERIGWNLDRFGQYIGVNNHMGSRATADPKIMTLLMEELHKREMIFLDSRTTPKSLGKKLAQEQGVPFIGRNVFLDNTDSLETVLKQLKTTENIARKHGYAVAIGHPRDGTIQALKQWLSTLQDKGISLVPLSFLILNQQKKA